MSQHPEYCIPQNLLQAMVSILSELPAHRVIHVLFEVKQLTEQADREAQEKAVADIRQAALADLAQKSGT